MRIQHNIMAMNAYRNYNNNTKGLSSNLEKLSSGYKINRAGDDAAGLAISEKMRAQITGLSAAQKNVKDGISLVKTAEGAMQEVQDMLNRMEYLATQSANGTYQDEVDRENLQKEVDALKTEINRIADSANFNGIKLLDGSAAGAAAGSLSDVTVTHVADALPAADKATKGVYSIDLKDFSASIASTSASGTVTISVGGQAVASATISTTGGSAAGADFTATTGTVTIGGVDFEAKMSGSKLTLTMKNDPTAKFDTAMDVTITGAAGFTTNGNTGHTLGVTVDQEAVPAGSRLYAQGKFDLGTVTDGMQLKIGKETYTFAVGSNSQFKNGSKVIDLTDLEKDDTDLTKIAARRLTQAASGNKMFKVTTDNDSGEIQITEKEGAGIDYTVNNLVGTSKTTHTDAGNAAWKGLVQKGQATTGGSSGLTLQIGDTSDNFNRLAVEIGDMHTSAMGIAGIDIGSSDGASEAISIIKNAINYVSGVRGDLGAVQNRLEHTANNLSVMAENIQDAESTIRDTDVAEEMMSYTKNNILVQSAQAMLAQANAVPQGVLQLLQ